MLERLQIKNFQNHELKRVRFDPQVTAIVGPSDAGKSSILRALKWLVMNRPRGDGFVRHGEKTCSVDLWVDSRKISRTRGPDNTYRIEGKELAAFGTDVPEDVQNAVRMDDVNFQGQHDPPFWFGLTPGELGKKLNGIVDLSLIDHTMKRLSSRLRSLKTEKAVVEERIGEAEVEVAGFDWVDDASDDFDELVALKGDASKRAGDRDRVSFLLVQAHHHKGLLDRASAMVQDAASLFQLGERAAEYDDQHERMIDLVEEAEGYTEVLGVSVPTEADLEGAVWHEVEIAETKTNQVERLAVLVSGALGHRRKAAEYDAELCDLVEELDEELEGLCPVCGRPWTPDHGESG